MPYPPYPKGPAAHRKVEKVMHEYKHGTLRSGRGGKGGPPKSREQAVAIALSEARKAAHMKRRRS